MVERVEENQAEKVQNWEHAFIWPAQGLTHTRGIIYAHLGLSTLVIGRVKFL